MYRNDLGGLSVVEAFCRDCMPTFRPTLIASHFLYELRWS